MLTRTTITTDTTIRATDPTNEILGRAIMTHQLQEWLDAELDQYMQAIIVPRIRRKFGVTVTVEVS